MPKAWERQDDDRPLDVQLEYTRKPLSSASDNGFDAKLAHFQRHALIDADFDKIASHR
jgi:hypothetical protein